MKNTNNQKGAALAPILIVLVIILAGATGYFAFVKKPAQAPALSDDNPTAIGGGNIDLGVPNAGTGQNSGNNSGNNNAGKAAVPVGWKMYKNEKYGFEFSYPAEAVLSERPTTDYNELLEDLVVSFDKENKGKDRNLANLSFRVYKKGTLYQDYSSEKCEVFRRFIIKFGQRIANGTEQKNCSGSEATGGSGHTLFVVIPLPESNDITYFANLNNEFIRNNDFGNKVLSTLSFF